MLRTTTTSKKTPLLERLEKIINRYRAKGLTAVVDYLLAKARESQRTAMTYSCALDYLNEFITKNFVKYDIQSILPELKQSGQIDVYKLLGSFVDYMQNETPNGSDLSPATLRLYNNASRSYFQFHDIDVIPSKYKYRVILPSLYHTRETPIDSNDIKEILHHCTVRRLKPFLLCLASGGMRSIECLSVRLCDVNFSDIDFSNPNDKSNIATVTIRKQFSKTRREHITFISNEAARYLKQWIDWKYRDRQAENKHLKNRIRTENDLIFSNVTYKGQYPLGLYTKIVFEFQKTLELAGMSARKEEGAGHKRRKITLHSFRRFCKTAVSNQASSDFSEFILGHKGSTYYNNKTEELKNIYKDKCQKYLTFLDYPTLEATSKDFEAQLKGVVAQKDEEIAKLNAQIQMQAEKLNNLSKQYHLNDVITDAERLQLHGLQAQIDALSKKLGLQP
jgi:integrase